MSDEREAFEAHFSASPFEWPAHEFDRGGEGSAWPGQYRHYQTQVAWEAWQAARREALEEAVEQSTDGSTEGRACEEGSRPGAPAPAMASTQRVESEQASGHNAHPRDRETGAGIKPGPSTPPTDEKASAMPSEDDPPIKLPLDQVRWLHERYAETKEIGLFDAAVLIEAQDRLCKRLAAEHEADVDLMELAAEMVERLTLDAQRLSWLDRDDVQLVCGTAGDSEPFVEIIAASVGRVLGRGKDIRAAIDAARGE